MKLSVSVPRPVHDTLLKHLIREDGQEDLCFALWHQSSGISRRTAIISEAILPEEDERKIDGNASFFPQYFERIIRIARRKKTGIAFLHSHPSPGWQDMSGTDRRTEMTISGAVKAATNLQLVGLTAGKDGTWSARFWCKNKHGKFVPQWCDSVRAIGDWLEISLPPALKEYRKRKSQDRSLAAWGESVQNIMSNIKVGVIGTGSVGSIVAESLARIGVGDIMLMDYDLIKTENLDRMLHSYEKDVGKPKVKVLAKAIKKSSSALNPIIEPLILNVCSEEGYRKALDCDVLFSCVDRPWPRSVLNHIALSHLIPVIDGGISVERRKDGIGMLRADWRALTVTPTRACMECLHQYDPGDVQADREGLFDNPGYIRNLTEDHFAKRNANVFGFSLNLASLELLQFISLMVPMPGRRNPGEQVYHFVPAILDISLGKCKPTCFPHSLLSLGDDIGLTLTT